MADEPTPAPAGPGTNPPEPNSSPPPIDPAQPNPVSENQSPATAASDPAAKEQKLEAEPLVDGTVPTVLSTGSGDPHVKQKSGRASLTSLYQRADIITTLMTFAGAVVAGGLILAGYAYFTKSTTPAAKAPKLSQLDQAELEKLSNFFKGNTPGQPAEVLTISSSSLFNNRVAMASDLKVVGGAQVTGPTALGDLTVDKTSTLGITNVRGQLTVSGPTTLQSPAVLAAGASVSGNVTVSGNGSFGGSLSAGTLNVRDLSISGTLSLAGHLAITGQNPSAAAQAGAGSGASASVDGNDTGGTVTVTTGSVASTTPNVGGLLATVTFRAPYPKVPRVVITPIGSGAGALNYYVQKTATGFTIGSANDARSSTAYSFDYWIVQ